MADTHIPFPCIEVKQGDQTCLYLGALTFDTLRTLYTVSPREARTDDPYYDATPSPQPQFSQRPERKERLQEISSFVEARLSLDSSGRKEIIFPGTVILGLLTDIEVHREMPDNATPTAAHLIEAPSDQVIEAVEIETTETSRKSDAVPAKQETTPTVKPLVKPSLNQGGEATENIKIEAIAVASSINEPKYVTIMLARQKASVFVIDGQHRIKGLGALHAQLEAQIAPLTLKANKLNDEETTRLRTLQEQLRRVLNFQVPISLLIDFDLEEQAMVFATVNFKQKPVQRSFYYDIFGTFESDKVTPISFSHELALHLNNSDKSPLKGMIKLLGTGPGLISQAFLVARLEPLLDPQDQKSVFRDYFVRRHSGKLQASWQFAGIVRNFFTAVSEEFPYAWPKRNNKGVYSGYDYDYILAKSMVMSGWLAILREIYKLSLIDFASGREDEVANANTFTSAFFKEFLSAIDSTGRLEPSKSEFARSSAWGVGGSTKIERAIFYSLRSDVFESYSKLTLDLASPYMTACSIFKGNQSAIKLCRAYTKETQQEFWSKTESEWINANPIQASA